MTIKTTEDQITFWREHATGPSVTHAIIQQLLDDHAELKARLHSFRDIEKRELLFAARVVRLQEELNSAQAMIEKASRIMREFLTWWREKGKHESSAYGAPGSIFSMDEFVEKSRAYLQAHPEPEGKGK